MKQFFKRCIIEKIIAARNYLSTPKTDRKDIQLFLKKLYPLSINKELIRLGPKGDGGYLLPDDLIGIEACFSPGVSFESGFEKDCAEIGMKVFLADKSVNGPATKHRLFHFTKKFIGAESNDDCMTLDHWVDASIPGTNSDLLLQIDIEGDEYLVFESASESLMRRLRIIVAEFHKLDQLWDKSFFHCASRVFDKILRTHSCVHIHPNNCSGFTQIKGFNIPQVMEFTFIRNDRIDDYSYQKTFPNPLDCNNSNLEATLVLPGCWYSDD